QPLQCVIPLPLDDTIIANTLDRLNKTLDDANGRVVADVLAPVRELAEAASRNSACNGQRIALCATILLVRQPNTLGRILLGSTTRPYRVLLAVFRGRPEVQLRTNPLDPASPHHQSGSLLVYRISPNNVVKDQRLAGCELLPEVRQQRTLSIRLIDPSGCPCLGWSRNVETLLVTQSSELILAHPSVRSRTTRIRRQILCHRRQIAELEGVAVRDSIPHGRKGARVAGTWRRPGLQINDGDT